MEKKAGLGPVLRGMAVFGAWKICSGTRNQVPIDVPLRLRAGRTLSEDFRIDLDGLYLMEISAEKNLPAETLRCLLGLEPDQAQCQGIAAASEVRWILFRDGHELRRGNSLEPHMDDPPLDSANPHLRVAIASRAHTDLRSAGVLVFSVSFFCVLFGTILLGIAWLAPRQSSETAL